jgi:hypothetical protein
MAKGVSAGPVERLMGVSPCLIRGSVVEKLLALRADFCGYNLARGSRSAIWYSSGWFLQWHEGPLAAVEEAWLTSQRYGWQGKHMLLHRSQGPHGLVDPLHLSTVHSRETPAEVARRIGSVVRQHELGWPAEPAEIWRQLTAPCLLAGADAMASVARENVVAVTSEYTESVDLVRAIAEQHRSELIYQRFADGGLAGVDAGAAYVDVAHGSQMTRVQALSRRALANSMVRLSLQQTQCVVLLLGSRASSAERLATSVADLLAGMEVWPAVRLVGSCAEACEAAARVLGQLEGLDVGVRFADTGGRAPVQAVLEVIGQLRRHSAFVASGLADLS